MSKILKWKTNKTGKLSRDQITEGFLYQDEDIDFYLLGDEEAFKKETEILFLIILAAIGEKIKSIQNWRKNRRMLDK